MRDIFRFRTQAKENREMLKKYLHFILILYCLGLSAQHTPEPDSTLWPLVERQLDMRPSDTTFEFILPIVRTPCGQDMACLLLNYGNIMYQLEHQRFHLPAAIAVGQEMIKIAHEHHADEEEASAYKRIGSYYDALGDSHKAIMSLDKALELYQKNGEIYQVTFLRANRIHLTQQRVEDVLPEMNALLTQVLATGDAQSIRYMHLVLLDMTVEAGQYDEAASHIAYLEKIPVSTPLQPHEYGLLIILNRGRAQLAEARNNLAEAEFYYQKTLRLCEAEPSLWLEIDILQLLANLEWKRNNTSIAKSYLQKAQFKAENLKLDDLLAPIFELKAKIAESEGDFENALLYLKKKYLCEARFKDKNAGFDLRRYNLQLEKDQLTTENRNRALQLELRSIQLRTALLSTLLILLLAAFLLVGLRRQRKQKQHLEAQNSVIQQQTEQLKSLDAAKSRFFANVSHELRTPLTLMLGPIHTLLKEKNWTDKQQRLLSIASQSGKQLEQLIGEILDLRKLESGNMKLHETPTEIRTFFNTYLAQFESLAEHKQIKFSYSVDAANGLMVHIDQAKCRQILYNLLSNAFKFTLPHGNISANVSIQNGRLHIQVADSGAGIHADDLPHVFDRFFQTSRPDKPVEGGTGIGLHLCQEYAHLFGGTIDVHSEEGKGSIFQVEFPVTWANNAPSAEDHALVLDGEAVLPANSAEALAVFVLDASMPTVLVVEDKVELQEYLRMILAEKYQVVTAENGQVALAWLTEQQKNGKPLPALILSDLMMPVMDGYQLLEKLKSDDNTRHIPVIMLTARVDVQDKLKALRIGVDDYLLKPFDEEELLVRMENLLKNQSMRQEYRVEESASAEKTPLLSAADRAWLETFEAYVRSHLASDLLTVPVLAHEFAMSESTLLRQLKRLTGLSPLQYIQEVRLHEARALLENGTYNSVALVALKTGYDDPRYFSRIFRQQFGKSPSDMLTN
ncbi:MAG: response regulator [Saprospiraceae bacterium]|nr:response regulator [Saprospiraceae bacterium]